MGGMLALEQEGKMAFRDATCKHLSEYKISTLGIREDGFFRHMGQNLLRTHILPDTSGNQNVLEPFREVFWASEFGKVLKRHRYFHHLNSSQALCINLFYPLISAGLLDLFARFLNLKSTNAPRGDFEVASEIEKTGSRRTSFDFCLYLSDTTKVLVEVKYTEDGFGKAKHDDEHKEKFRETYLPLVEHSRFVVKECRDEAFFLNHYQLLRNLIHISDTDHVVLLYPSANEPVAAEAHYARDNLVNEAGRQRLHLVALEAFVLFLEQQCADGPLNGYFQSFQAKYLPGTS